MTTPTSAEYSLDRARLLERACDRFERACRAGPARPEDFLADVPEDMRAELLGELLELEAYHRSGPGPTAVAENETPAVSGVTMLGGGPAPLRVEKVGPPRPHVTGYEVLGELGRGGMGVVYKARHLALNRTVALKMILAGDHAGPQQFARFRAEAEAVARLHHPGIVQVYEVGEAGGLPYLALELVEGGGLDARLAGTPLPARDAARLVELLARALSHAHDKGVVHRDLKPANVLLMPDGTPKVTDFGLAKRLAEAGGDRPVATQTGAVVGTPSYMAPEQASGRSKEVGPAADVWALGAILYECLTGRPPFKAETGLETLMQVQSADPVSPRRLQPRVPGDLETIALKCLRKEPRRRYASAAALADDLGHFLAGRAITARPVGAAERALKWARRRPGVAGLLTLLVATVAAAFALVMGLWLDADLQRDRAEEARELAFRTAEAEAEGRRREADIASALKGALEDTRKALKAAQLSSYHQSIARADLELEANNPLRAERLLDACPPGLRQWEWRYLRGKSRAEMQLLEGHTDTVLSVAYSPDGRLLASGGSDQTVRLWALPSGEPVATLRGHTNQVTSLAFSADGRRLVSGAGYWQDTARGEVCIWEVGTRQRQRHFFKDRLVWGVAFRPDGRQVAVAWGSAVTVHDAATGDERHHVDCPSTAHGLAYSPDGQQVAVALRDGTVRQWSPSRGQGLTVVLRHKADARRVAYSPDGRWLASTSFTGQLAIHDFTKGKTGLQPAHEKVGGGLAFSPDSKTLGTASSDGSIKLWDCGTRELRSHWRGHERGVGALAFSPGGEAIATAGYDHFIKIWEAGSGAPPPKYRLPGPTAVAFSPDGRLFAVAGGRPQRRPSEKGTHVGLAVYDTATRRQLCGVAQANRPFRTVSFRPDGLAVAANWGNGVRFWDSRTGRVLQSFTAHEGPVSAVAFSPDGLHLATASDGGEVKVWVVAAEGRPITPRQCSLRSEHQGPVISLAYSPDGRQFASAGADGTVRIWGDDGRLRHALRGHEGAVNALAFHRDGRRLASAGADKTIRIWDASSGKPLLQLRGHALAVSGVAFSPKEPRLVSTGNDRSLVVWDVDGGQEIFTLRRVLTGDNARVVFSPDGRWVVANGWGTIRGPGGFQIWDGEPPENLSHSRRRLAWHAREAEKCEALRRWPAAIHQLGVLVGLEPDNASHHYRRAWAHLYNDDWPKADEGSARAVALGLDVTDLRRHHFLASRLRWLFADNAEYQKLCRAMLDRHAQSNVPGHLFEAARFCLLSPDSGIDPRVCVRMMERALKLKLPDALRYDTLALAHYRAGDWGEAIRAGARGLKEVPNHAFILDRYFVQAMAHHQRGDGQGAKRYFSQGMKQLAANDARWRDGRPWLLEEAIRYQNEAAALLKMPAVNPLGPRKRP